MLIGEVCEDETREDYVHAEEFVFEFPKAYQGQNRHKEGEHCQDLSYLRHSKNSFD